MVWLNLQDHLNFCPAVISFVSESGLLFTKGLPSQYQGPLCSSCRAPFLPVTLTFDLPHFIHGMFSSKTLFRNKFQPTCEHLFLTYGYCCELQWKRTLSVASYFTFVCILIASCLQPISLNEIFCTLST